MIFGGAGQNPARLGSRLRANLEEFGEGLIHLLLRVVSAGS